MTRNRSRDDLDLRAENICSSIELLITELLNSLTAHCIDSSTINTFKMHVSYEPKNFKLFIVMVEASYGETLCLLMPIMSHC